MELKLIIELHIGPNYALQIAEVLESYPESTVLIDHLAEPHMGDAVEYAHVLDLANFEKVYMKLSGLNHFAQDAPFYFSVRPFTAKVIEAFGPGRMVWGAVVIRLLMRIWMNFQTPTNERSRGEIWLNF